MCACVHVSGCGCDGCRDGEREGDAFNVRNACVLIPKECTDATDETRHSCRILTNHKHTLQCL